VLKVHTRFEPGAAVAVPFRRVKCRSWYEDGPQVLEGDDFVLDIIESSRNDILEFYFEDREQQFKMLFRLFVLFFVECRSKFLPSMNKGIEW
jgi:hypothetical protein